MTPDRRRPTHAEVSLLSDLTTLMSSARDMAKRAADRRMPATTKQARHIAQQLDAARTCLVQEGPDYLPTAEAILDAAAERLSAHAIWIGKCAYRDPRRAVDA